jgi:TetR/AcrR family transcriptional repressor of mexJK operon
MRPSARGEARKKELAEVAERVFLRLGFSDTTMQTIATEARASKETLYRHFISKEALFSEIVHNRAMTIFGPSGVLEPEAPPADILFRVGYNLLQTMTRPDSLALYRVVIAETPRVPELGCLFYAEGPAHVQEQLAAYLAGAIARKRVSCSDPASACRLFLGAVIANYHILALITAPAAPPTDASIRRHVEEAVTMFMARYAAAA